MGTESNLQRLGILAQWSKNETLPPHVRIHLERLRPYCSRLILVSNSPLNDQARTMAMRVCDRVLERPNRGYDFSAWRTALMSEDMTNWDEVLLTNSSVIGPLFSLSAVFETMNRRSCDFWGLTYCGRIERHIQSYFLMFRSSILQSDVWERYWKNVADIVNKKTIIRTYEIKMKKYFEENGFISDTFVSDNTAGAPRLFFRRPISWLPVRVPSRMTRVDPTFFLPYETILKGMPYLKASVVWTRYGRQHCPIEKIKALPQVDYPWDEIGL